jgi:hypothetical protein
MRRATEGAPRRDFVVPSGIRFVQVNPVSGHPAMPWGPRGVEVALREGQLGAFLPVAGAREPSPTGGGQ